MLDLTKRELATVILFGALVACFVLIPGWRRQVGPSFKDVLKALFAWQLVVSLVAYLSYATAVVLLARRVGAWEPQLIKETTIAVVFVGVPLVFGASQVASGSKLARDVMRRVLGASAFVAAYLGFGSLPLWGELLLQPTLTLFALVAVVAHGDPENRPAEKLADGILSLAGFGLFVYTGILIARTWDERDVTIALQTFAISVWLPLSLIPFLYVFSFVVRTGVVLTMLEFFNDREKPPLRVRLACVWGLHFSTRLAAEFDHQWRRRVAKARTFREALVVMREFRLVRDRAAKSAS